MKKIAVMVVYLMSMSVFAADFLISLSPKRTTVKGDGVEIGKLFVTGMNWYVESNGKNWILSGGPGNPDSNGKFDYLVSIGACYFTSPDCTGTCLVPPLSGNPLVVAKNVVSAYSSTKVLLLEMLDGQTISDGTLAIGSCSNASDAYGTCRTTLSCTGASQVLSSGLVKNGITLKHGQLVDRSTFPGRPSHDFKLSIIEME